MSSLTPRAKEWGGWDRVGPTPNPAWQQRLDSLAPPAEKIQSLHVYFEAGYAWEPVERWMIGRVTPPGFIPEFLLDALKGPNPADDGHFDVVKGEFVPAGTGLVISRRQWKFYQETGCLIEPLWVVQGSHGGHKYRFTRAEEVISRLAGGPKQPPAPGDLPYAEPSERTFELLGLADRVRQGVKTLDFIWKNGVRLTEEDEKEQRTMRERTLAWLHNGAKEWGEMSASHAVKELWENAPAPSSNLPVRAGEMLEKIEDAYLRGDD